MQVSERARESCRKELSLLGQFYELPPEEVLKTLAEETFNSAAADNKSVKEEDEELVADLSKAAKVWAEERMQILTICHKFIMLFLIMDKVSSPEAIDCMLTKIWQKKNFLGKCI